MAFSDLVRELVAVMYQVGVVGVKPEPHVGRLWSYMDDPVLSDGQLTDTAMLEVHKTFWAVLGITRRSRRERENQ